MAFDFVTPNVNGICVDSECDDLPHVIIEPTDIVGGVSMILGSTDVLISTVWKDHVDIDLHAHDEDETWHLWKGNPTAPSAGDLANTDEYALLMPNGPVKDYYGPEVMKLSGPTGTVYTFLHDYTDYDVNDLSGSEPLGGKRLATTTAMTKFMFGSSWYSSVDPRTGLNLSTPILVRVPEGCGRQMGLLCLDFNALAISYIDQFMAGEGDPANLRF